MERAIKLQEVILRTACPMFATARGECNTLVWNCWTGALAHLGLARAYALSDDTAKAKAAYNGSERNTA